MVISYIYTYYIYIVPVALGHFLNLGLSKILATEKGLSKRESCGTLSETSPFSTKSISQPLLNDHVEKYPLPKEDTPNEFGTSEQIVLGFKKPYEKQWHCRKWLGRLGPQEPAVNPYFLRAPVCWEHLLLVPVVKASQDPIAVTWPSSMAGPTKYSNSTFDFTWLKKKKRGNAKSPLYTWFVPSKTRGKVHLRFNPSFARRIWCTLFHAQACWTSPKTTETK